MQLLTGNDGHYHIAWNVMMNGNENHIVPVDRNGNTEHYLHALCFCEPKLDKTWTAWPIYKHCEVEDVSD